MSTKAMKSIITIALLLSAIVSYGQIPPSFTGTASYRGIKTVYDTVPSLLQISDTAGYVDYVRGYKGFVVYKNQLVEGPFTGMSFFREQPSICKYLRNDKQPLSPQYVVWMNKDLRGCILQPIKGL
jgi:hypothetical protein